MNPYSLERVRQSIVHFVLGKGLGLTLGASLLLLLVRALSLRDYAFFLASQALLELADQFSSVGLITAAQRYAPECLSQRQGRQLRALVTFLTITRLLTLVVALSVVWVLAEPISSVLGMTDLIAQFRLFLLVILFECFARYLEALFESLLLQGLAQVTALLRAAMRVGMLAWLYFSGHDAVDLESWIFIDACAGLAGCVVGGIALWRVLFRLAAEYPGSKAVLEIRRYFAFAIPGYLAGSLYTMSGTHLVRLVASSLLPPQQFASFGFAAVLAAMFQRYLPAFFFVGIFRPLFVAARMRSNYRETIPALASLILKLNAFVLLPATAFFVIGGQPAASILSGNRYPEAGYYLIAFALLTFVQSLRIIVSVTAQAMENSRAPLVGTILGLIGLVAGIGLVSPFGGYGLCAGIIISELILTLWVNFALSNEEVIVLGKWAWLSRLSTVAVCTFAVGLAYSLVFDIDAIPALVGLCMIMISAYLAIAFVLKPFSPEERALINTTLKTKAFVW